MTQLSDLITNLFGTGVTISASRPVSGGDINDASLLLLSDGTRLFLKENLKKNSGFFMAEQAGLAAIRETETIGVPKVLASGTADGRAFLLMEFLEAGPKQKDYWTRFGHGLAAMHRADAARWTPGGRYGFTEDNYIGAGAQSNAVRADWVTFFRECRLGVQAERARRCFDREDRRAMEQLLDHLDDYLEEPEQPSLLHGDLWGGNFVTGPDGHAWLIDPAVYVGDAEADIAMTELFGGFAPAFYDAYKEAGLMRPGYADRRDLYNLYHLLNHLNLFGGGYYGAVMRIVRRYT